MAYFIPAADDAFDDEADECMIMQNEWNRAENDIRMTGYRLGLDAGQEETQQKGFDAGYKESALVAFEVGRLQGKISASLNLIEMATHSQENTSSQVEGSQLTTSLMKLLEDCTSLLHSVPQKLQAGSDEVVTKLFSTLPLTQLYTENGSQLPSSKHPYLCKPGCDVGDGLREVTELMDSVGLQETVSSSAINRELQQNFMILMDRYRSLCC